MTRALQRSAPSHFCTSAAQLCVKVEGVTTITLLATGLPCKGRTYYAVRHDIRGTQDLFKLPFGFSQYKAQHGGSYLRNQG